MQFFPSSGHIKMYWLNGNFRMINFDILKMGDGSKFQGTRLVKIGRILRKSFLKIYIKKYIRIS